MDSVSITMDVNVYFGVTSQVGAAVGADVISLQHVNWKSSVHCVDSVSVIQLSEYCKQQSLGNP